MSVQPVPPVAVGLPDTLLYYSGDRATFDEHETTLRVLGGDTVHLGEEPDLAEEIDSGDYGRPLSSVGGKFYEGIAYDKELDEEANLDVAWTEPMHDLLRRAVAEGHREESISVLYELLRKPAQAS